MKTPLPSTVAGWVVFYLFWIVVAVIAAWAFTKTDLPQGIQNFLTLVVGGLLGFLSKKEDPRPPAEVG